MDKPIKQIKASNTNLIRVHGRRAAMSVLGVQLIRTVHLVSSKDIMLIT